MKKVLYIGLILITILCLTACSGNVVYVPDSFDDKVSSQELETPLIAENDVYRLEWDSQNSGVALIEKSTGRRWGTTPIKEGQAAVDEYGMPIKKNPQLQSSVMIEYLSDEQKQVKSAISYTGAYKNGRIVTSLIENGVRVEYYFDKEEIMIPVEYVLRSDSVAVTFDPSKVQENNNQLLSVGLAPFWCSSENDVKESYLFLPSGSGALVSCTTQSQQGSKFSYSVYGDDAVMQKEDLITTEKSVLLPVFGSKSGNSATCAIIENSAESAYIKTILGSSAIKYSTIYAAYQVRGYSSNVAAMLYGESQKREVYAASMAKEPMTVGFYPLTDASANYSGMAEVYKRYLKSQNMLSKKKDDGVLNLTFIGGTMVDKSLFGIPYKELLAATTLKDVNKILAEISSKTDIKINAKLVGFGETGIDYSKYAGGFGINKNIGSKKDLSALLNYCKENNIDLFFDFDLIRFNENSSGYNTWSDVAFNACYKKAVGYKYDIATHSRIEDESFYYLSRKYLIQGADKLFEKIRKWNLSGVSLSSISNITYSDYSDRTDNEYYSKGNMSRDVHKIISTFAQDYNIAVTDANSYAVVLADVIYDAPNCSSNEKTFICDIPFYQMIFKGYIAMGGESLNLASDYKKQLLSYVESGTGLSYMLINNYCNEFIDSSSYYFFGTKFDDLKEKLYETYGNLKEYYNAVNGAEIISHTILDNGVRETVYSNGIKVYVNYSKQSVQSPLGEINALSYLWR